TVPATTTRSPTSWPGCAAAPTGRTCTPPAAGCAHRSTGGSRGICAGPSPAAWPAWRRWPGPAPAPTRPATSRTGWSASTPRGAGGVGASRPLALLATHRKNLARVRAELANRDRRTPQDLPYLRACVLEAVRLWPTTLVVLRDSTEATDWRGHQMPPGATVVIV